MLRSGIGSPTVTGLTFTDHGLLPNTPYLYSIAGAGVTTPVLTATLGCTRRHVHAAPPATITAPRPGRRPPGARRNLRVTGTTAEHHHPRLGRPGRRQL